MFIRVSMVYKASEARSRPMPTGEFNLKLAIFLDDSCRTKHKKWMT